MKKLNKKGFTIVELVIVIAVIAILAAVLIPTYTSVVDKANESQALQNVRNAYTLTIADELEPDATDKTITTALASDAILVEDNGKIVKIDKNGSASISTGKATYEIDATTGKIVAKTE